MSRRRTKQRELKRAIRKQIDETEALAARLPGSSREHPIDVASASVVETKALATPCIQCGGAFDLRADRATSTPRGVLRELEVVCRRCHTPRAFWFRIPPPSAN